MRVRFPIQKSADSIKCIESKNPTQKIKVCVAGKNEIALNALKLLQTRFQNDEICVIPNRNDTGIDTWQPSLLKYALQASIPVCTLEQVQQIANVLFLSLEFDRLLRVEQFASKRLYNIHFSALPKYKGVYTSITPILNGESSSGVTLHCIDNGIDTGDIIAQRIFKIGLQECARDLYFKYLKQGFMLLLENLDSLLSGNFQCTKQDFRQSSYFSRTAIDVKNININLKKTSFEIHNQLRAFIFREYQLPRLNGVSIAKSILSGEFIGANVFRESENMFILSGIDGFKIMTQKAIADKAILDNTLLNNTINNLDSAGGGGYNSLCCKTFLLHIFFSLYFYTKQSYLFLCFCAHFDKSLYLCLHTYASKLNTKEIV